jgi:hypothetical protein
MAQREATAKLAAEACLSDSYRGQRCIDSMKDFLKTPSTRAELGFQFGKIVRKHQNHYVAAPFFKWALDKQPNAAWCSDEDLKMAVTAALGLPSDYEEATAGRSVAAGACWSALKDAIGSELQKEGTGYFRDNACAVLKAKGAL